MNGSAVSRRKPATANSLHGAMRFLGMPVGTAARPRCSQPVSRGTLEVMSSTSIGVERTGPSIRAVLAEHAPERCVEFEAEFRIALAEADEDFDLERVQAVLDKWWPITYSVVHPPTEVERALVARFRAGNDTGLWRGNGGRGW